MKVEELKTLLKALGVEDTTTATLLSEDALPDKFDIKAIAEEVNNSRREAIEAQYKPKLEAELKKSIHEDAKKGVEGSFKTKLKSTFGLNISNADLKEKEVKDLFDMVSEKFKVDASQTDNEWKTKYQEVAGKNTELLDQLNEAKEGLKSKDEEFETFKTSYDHQFRKKDYLQRRINVAPIAHSSQKNLEYLRKNILSEAESLIDVRWDEEGRPKEIVSVKDGVHIINQETQTAIKDFDKWLDLYLVENGIKDLSNGDKKTPGSVDVIKNAEGKEVKVDRSASSAKAKYFESRN